MADLICDECGSPDAYPPAPALCHTPFCHGRMGGSDEYVPSRVEATRNMGPGDLGTGGRRRWRDLVLDVAPDAAERRQYAPGEVIPVRKEDLQPGGFAYEAPVEAPAEAPVVPQDPQDAPARPAAPQGAASPHQNVLLAIPTDHAERKRAPMCTGLLDYFPAALMAVANLSLVGNEQHNPGEPLHWARGKSTDQPDTIVRHLMQRGTLDTDGVRHSTKVAWRALALLQEEIERDAGFTPKAD
jgi:hypothetical protein